MGASQAIIAIVIAVVGGSGVPVWLLTRLDKKNTEQHGESRSVLDSIRSDLTEVKDDVSEVKGNLIDHLNYHLTEGGRDGSAERVDNIAARAKVRSASSVTDSPTEPCKRSNGTA
jgi:hypothetical protein